MVLIVFQLATQMIEAVEADAVVYTGFRGWAGSRQAWGGTFLHWRNQKFRIFSNSIIFKKC